MRYVAPHSIELTESEAELYSRIPEAPPHEGWDEIADAMQSLVSSLSDRHAVPKVRLRLFCDPNYAETRNKSPQQVFESNGTSGRDIFRHPHFIPYLRHFIHGPYLPEAAIEGLCSVLNDDMGTSGMIMDKCCKHARSCVRKYRLNRAKAATEFFRLGVEVGMEIHEARGLRDAARSTR
jgi:hypothetical protein